MYSSCYNCKYTYNNFNPTLCNGCLIENLIYLKRNQDHGLMWYYQLRKYLVGR